MVECYGIEMFDFIDMIVDELCDLIEGCGVDFVVDVVGFEVYGNFGVEFMQKVVGLLFDFVVCQVFDKVGVDWFVVVYVLIDVVCCGGMVLLSGVYVGDVDIMLMKIFFDKQIILCMGQCNVKNWVDDLVLLVEDIVDLFGVMDFMIYNVLFDDVFEFYCIFQQKEDGCIKVVLYFLMV